MFNFKDKLLFDTQLFLEKTYDTLNKSERRYFYSILEHGLIVGEFSYALSKYLDLSEESIYYKVAGYLHDVGKLKVPQHIVNKPARLDKMEFEIVKTHVNESFIMLSNAKFCDLICLTVKQHHENYFGEGYPDGLSGDFITMGGRILRVCDVFAALTEERPYRNKLTISEALKQLQQEKSNYDPYVLNKFINMLTHENVLVTSTYDV